MKNKATANTPEKRVAVTVYMTNELSDEITKGYAAALLNGFTGTKQAFINYLLNSALVAARKEV